jgi:beta-mannosidase
MTDQAPALRLLASLCWQLDPTRPFLPTSPVDGIGHGPYTFRDHVGGGEIWSVFQTSACTAYNEFGCSAPTFAEIAQSVLPEAERWPPRPETPWDAHTGVEPGDAFGHQILKYIVPYLGPVTSLEDFEAKGQLLQREGIRGLYEEARRQKPRAAMALAWCLNEPWPTLVNCSLVAWPARPKLGYDGARLACRPVLASARIRKFAWVAGEKFDPQLWILNDSPQAAAAGRMSAALVLNGQRVALGTWEFPEIPANQNLAGPMFSLELPAAPRGSFTLELAVDGHPERGSTYTLCFGPHDPAMLDVRGAAK